jgi:rare lipoprotein A
MPRFRLRRMRSVHVIIVITMLAVPASALAISGVTQSTGHTAQNPLNVNVNPRRVKFGGAVRVSGAAPATEAGKRVVVQAAAHSLAPWHQVAATTVRRDGRFSVRVVPRRSGVLRAVEETPATVPVATTPVTDAPGRPAAPVTVTAQFKVERHESAVLGGGRTHLGGKLLPAQAGRVVRLQHHTSAGWRTLTSGRTGARGGYRVGYAANTADGQRLRMLFGGDRGNARTVEPAGTVRVLQPSLASWYDDGGNTACGFHAGLGVANRTLPCGTKVTMHYGGRTVDATVDDRGPFAGGREWDLNQNTASALGFAGVGTVWASD